MVCVALNCAVDTVIVRADYRRARHYPYVWKRDQLSSGFGRPICTSLTTYFKCFTIQATAQNEVFIGDDDICARTSCGQSGLKARWAGAYDQQVTM